MLNRYLIYNIKITYFKNSKDEEGFGKFESNELCRNVKLIKLNRQEIDEASILDPI